MQTTQSADRTPWKCSDGTTIYCTRQAHQAFAMWCKALDPKAAANYGSAIAEHPDTPHAALAAYALGLADVDRSRALSTPEAGNKIGFAAMMARHSSIGDQAIRAIGAKDNQLTGYDASSTPPADETTECQHGVAYIDICPDCEL